MNIIALRARMHPSRMRTVRSSSRLCSGGGGEWVVSQHALRQTLKVTAVKLLTNHQSQLL